MKRMPVVLDHAPLPWFIQHKENLHAVQQDSPIAYTRVTIRVSHSIIIPFGFPSQRHKAACYEVLSV